MLRKKVLGIGANSATLLVQDTEANNALRVLRRVNVGDLSRDEIAQMQQFYETLQSASPRMSAVVEVHTILLQNTFLNIITSYGAGGDVSTFLDDELSDALPENTALSWLLIAACAVKQMRDATSLPYYGLSLDRVYFTEKPSPDGASLPETVVVGLPLPPSVYQKGLTDRIQQGLAVEREYPPEVLAKKGCSGYDASFSDVWVLGRMAERLLSVNTQLSSRSSRTRELITRMSASQPRERYTLDQVITTLTATVGKARLPVRERASTNTAHSGAKSHTSDAPTLQRGAQRHRHTPQQRTATPTRDAAGSANGSPGPAWQQKAQQQFNALKRMNSGTQGSPLRRTHSRGLEEPSPQRQRVASRPAGGGRSSRPNSAQRLARTGSSNSSLRASHDNKGLLDAAPTVSGHSGDGVSSRSATPNNAKIRDLLAEQQENLRLRRERLRQEREQQRKQGGGGSAGVSTRSVDGSEATGTPDAEAESEDAEPNDQLRRHLQNWRQKRAAEAAAAEARGDGTDGDRAGVLVFTPPTSSAELEVRATDDAAKRPRSRKNASPAVRRQVGSPRGSGDTNSSQRMSTPDAHSFANLKGNQAPIHYTRQKDIPITVAVPKGFEEDENSPREAGFAGGRVRRGEGVASPPGARRRPASRQGRQEWVGTTHTPDSSTCLTPSDATPQRDVPQPVGRHVGVATPPKTPPPRSADLPTNRPQVPETRAHVDPAPSSTDQSVDSAGAGVARGASSDRATQTALQCAIDALRTSIRNLCRNRNLYGEAMVISSEFARQTEAIRTAPRANEEFMRRLKEGLSDNRLFAAAAPLCAQLVALEGLEQGIFDAQRAAQRGGR